MPYKVSKPNNETQYFTNLVKVCEYLNIKYWDIYRKVKQRGKIHINGYEIKRIEIN